MVAQRITVDGGILRNRELNPAARALRAWEAEGKVEIFEADRVLDAPSKRRTAVRTAGNLSFPSASLILYPHRDPQRLSMTEINDVAHLIRHDASGNVLFVTPNRERFIDDGKREELLVSYRLTVLTPEEAVDELTSRE